MCNSLTYILTVKDLFEEAKLDDTTYLFEKDVS
jgi:hypothetical protein